jgi:hypothetical protein
METNRREPNTGAAIALGIMAMVLCCGAPLLVVAAGALFAVFGWAVVGVPLAVLVLVATMLVAVRWRSRRTSCAGLSVDRRSLAIPMSARGVGCDCASQQPERPEDEE